jgi:hypothetical protein
VILHMLPNVQQATIKPVITQAVAPGTLIHTDEYDIYARLPAWGYGHKTVCHAHGEYARDDTATGSAKSTSTPLRASGRCCAPGCARTVASRKTNCRCISGSSSSCITPVAAAKLCSAPSSEAWSDEASYHPETQQEPLKLGSVSS